MTKKIFLLIIMLMIMAACGTTPDISKEVKDKTFVLREKVVLDGGKEEVAFTLGFEDEKIRGRALNTFMSNYEIDGNNIRILPVATTLMAGPEELMVKEAQYLEDLQNAANISIVEDSLIIITHDGKKLNFDEVK